MGISLASVLGTVKRSKVSERAPRSFGIMKALPSCLATFQRSALLTRRHAQFPSSQKQITDVAKYVTSDASTFLPLHISFWPTCSAVSTGTSPYVQMTPCSCSRTQQCSRLYTLLLLAGSLPTCLLQAVPPSLTYIPLRSILAVVALEPDNIRLVLRVENSASLPLPLFGRAFQ